MTIADIIRLAAIVWALAILFMLVTNARLRS